MSTTASAASLGEDRRVASTSGFEKSRPTPAITRASSRGVDRVDVAPLHGEVEQ